MPAIGSVTCDHIWKRGHADPAQRIEPYEVRGVNGGGLLDTGQGVGTFRYECKYKGTAAEVNTWSASMAGLKAEGLISATDDRGVIKSNLQVIEVSELVEEDYKDPEDGSKKVCGTHMVSGQIMS